MARIWLDDKRDLLTKIRIVWHGFDVFWSVCLVVSNSTITKCCRACNTSFRVHNLKVKINVSLCAIRASISSGENFCIEVIISILLRLCTEDWHSRGDCVSEQSRWSTWRKCLIIYQINYVNFKSRKRSHYFKNSLISPFYFFTYQ